MVPVAAILLLASSPVAASTPSASIAVRLYQPFGDPRKAAVVEGTVENIFAKAGISLTWEDCAGPGRDWPAESPCARRPRPGEVILRLLDHSATGRGPCSHGFALVPNDGRIGVFATVFTDGLGRLTATTIASAEQILAHFTAHEIGHLLLGEGHGMGGLMSARWSRAELDRASRGQLHFSAAEAASMRARLAAAAPSESVADLAPAQGTKR